MSTDEHQIKCAVSFHKGKLLFTQRITKTFCSAGIFPAEMEAEYHETT